MKSKKSMPVIAARTLVKAYVTPADVVYALNGASLDIFEGEYVAVMGPSGSGKSTLMNILGCLDTPTAGKYYFEGADVSELDQDELAEIRSSRIGFIFQSFNLLPRISILRNVALPLIYSGVSGAERELRAARALNLAGIDESLFTHKSNEISGGQMQRVAIARALVNEPAIIFADEPTGNLDSRTGEVVLDTFEELNNKGRTIVMVTHEMEVALRAKRIIHLRDGRIDSDEPVTEEMRERFKEMQVKL